MKPCGEVCTERTMCSAICLRIGENGMISSPSRKRCEGSGDASPVPTALAPKVRSSFDVVASRACTESLRSIAANTSALRTRPCIPEPESWATSIPASRASRRARGLGRRPCARATAARESRRIAAETPSAACIGCAGCADGKEETAIRSVESRAITLPMETVSPSAAKTLSSVPLAGEGTGLSPTAFGMAAPEAA